MNIRNRKQLREYAAESLGSARSDPRMIALIYGGIACGLSLLSTVLSFVLSNRIADTGGLGNMGLRSALSTAKYVLPIIQTVVVLSLELGYCSAALRILRRRAAGPSDLTEGFRRFGPMIRSVLLQGLLFFGIAIGAMYASTYLFMLLPAADTFYDLMMPVLESMTTLSAPVTIDEATLEQAMSALMPMLWIFAGVYCVVATPLIYSFRMVNFCLADDDRPGALMAMGRSRQMMRGNRVALFRLDLGFWWYYLLQILISLIAYGDVLLPMLGVTLPWSETVSYFLFYVLSLVIQLAVYCFFMNRVQVTYAAAYEALKPQPHPQSGGVVLGNIFDLAKDQEE